MKRKAHRSQSWVSTELTGEASWRLNGVGKGSSHLKQPGVPLPAPQGCVVPHLSFQLCFHFPFDC